MTHLQLAQLSAAIYDAESTWVWRAAVGDIVLGIADLGDGGAALVFRGSVTAHDWFDDFEALPQFDPEVGFVHAGFLCGLDDALLVASAQIPAGAPLWMTGHSLGAARARIAAAKLLVRGMSVAGCVVFGSPKPGFANVRRVLEKSGVVHASYRNRNDPVPLVPFTAPPLLPWEHTEAWTAIDDAPGSDDLDPLRDHSMARYVSALSGVTVTTVKSIETVHLEPA